MDTNLSRKPAPGIKLTATRKQDDKRYHELPLQQRHQLLQKAFQHRKRTCMLRRLRHRKADLKGPQLINYRVKQLLYRRSLDTRGEPMYKRPAPWRMMINTSDVARFLGIHKRTAQQKLKQLKEKFGRGRNGYITVKEFCEAYYLHEPTVQQILNDEDARRYNSTAFQKKIDEINRKHDEAIRKIQALEKQAGEDNEEQLDDDDITDKLP